MINELTVDGQVKKDIEVFEDKIAFVVSIPTHKDELTGKDVFTFIKILYVGEMTDKTKNTIRAGNTIRIYGKLDSERFITKLITTVFYIWKKHEIHKKCRSSVRLTPSGLYAIVSI